MVDALTGKWSRFVEGLVAPGVQKLFKQWGIHIDSTSQRVRRYTNGEGIEIDILAVGPLHAVVIEARSTLKVQDVNDHIERVEKFKHFYPEYKDRSVIGTVAGIVMDDNSDRYAYKNGFFVIAQSGDTVTILNDDKFKPKIW